MNQIKRNIDNTTRKRLVIGVILVIGALVLVGSLINGNTFFTIVAIAGLIIGGFMFTRAMVRIDGAHNAMELIETRVTNAKIRLAEIIAQLSSTN